MIQHKNLSTFPNLLQQCKVVKNIRMIENKIWVYPIRLSDNYKTMIKGKYKSYTEVFGKVGIPGITKIKYSYE